MAAKKKVAKKKTTSKSAAKKPAPTSTAKKTSPPKSKATAKSDVFNMHDFVSSVIQIIRAGKTDEKKSELAQLVAKSFTTIIRQANLEHYNFVFLCDEHESIGDTHADSIYSAVTGFKTKKPICCVINSRGGRVEPAYLISKTCKRNTPDGFIVAVPRKAKSAATLIALGADQIHMGLMSELGPIDPQIGGIPALGTANALEVLAELVTKYPQASTLFSQYLGETLNLHLLGYFQRLNESSVQYASRLLEGKQLPAGKSIQNLSDHFVNHYKDHSFVIDIDEAKQLLGDKVIKVNTPEYSCANRIYKALNVCETLCSIIWKKHVSLVGNLTKGLNLTDVTDNE